MVASMDSILEVVDLSLLLEKATVKGAPPDSVQRLGVAVLSAKFMKESGIRLGQPILLSKLLSERSSISTATEEDSLSLSMKQISLVDNDIFVPSCLLLIAWPLSFLPCNVIALDTWSCSILFLDAWQRQVIHDTTLEVASKMKKEMDRRNVTFSSSTPHKKKTKSSKPSDREEDHVTIGVRLTGVYDEAECCGVADTVVWRIAGFGPPSVDGQLEQVDSKCWQDDEHMEWYVKRMVSKRYIMPGSWIVVSKDGRDLYLICDHIVESSHEESSQRQQQPHRMDGSGRRRIWKIVVGHTKMEWLHPVSPYSSPTVECLGGLEQQIAKMESFLSSCCFHQAYLDQLGRLGIPPSRGMLLYGPPGTGKSSLAQLVASRLPFHHVQTVRATSLVSSSMGETESRLMEIFHQVGDRVPSMLILEDIDVLGVSRESFSSSATEAEWRQTHTLLQCIDGMPKRMVVIGTTSRLDALDRALRRPGRLDMELEVAVPNCNQRFSILCQLAQRMSSGKEFQIALTEDDWREIADDLHGYVGADIVALWRESCYYAYQRWTQSHDSSIPRLVKEDIQRARLSIFPSAMREIVVQVAQVCWDDIGGYDEVKRQLREAVEWPKKFAAYFHRFGISPMKGILLYGPPGCSKTLMAKALANETSCHFLAIKGPELFQKWVGESEKAVRNLFRKAKSVAPCIIFFDEIDALGCRRQDQGSHAEQRVLAQLLTEMDGIASNGIGSTEEMMESWIFVLGATNRPDLLDPALIRPGRFDRLVYVGLPDSEAREQILRIHCQSIPLKESSMDWKRLVEATHGMTGAELASVCREATLNALKDEVTRADCSCPQVTYGHFEMALQQVKPRTSTSLLTFYEMFAKESGHHHIFR